GFTPAATLFLTSAKGRYEQPFRKVPTVYRKESRPVAKRPADEREPSGFPLSYFTLPRSVGGCPIDPGSGSPAVAAPPAAIAEPSCAAFCPRTGLCLLPDTRPASPARAARRRCPR